MCVSEHFIGVTWALVKHIVSYVGFQNYTPVEVLNKHKDSQVGSCILI